MASSVVAEAGAVTAARSGAMAQETSWTVTGLPAALIILVILALIVIGIVAVVRFVARKAKSD